MGRKDARHRQQRPKLPIRATEWKDVVRFLIHVSKEAWSSVSFFILGGPLLDWLLGPLSGYYGFLWIHSVLLRGLLVETTLLAESRGRWLDSFLQGSLSSSFLPLLNCWRPERRTSSFTVRQILREFAQDLIRSSSPLYICSVLEEQSIEELLIMVEKRQATQLTRRKKYEKRKMKRMRRCAGVTLSYCFCSCRSFVSCYFWFSRFFSSVCLCVRVCVCVCVVLHAACHLPFVFWSKQFI